MAYEKGRKRKGTAKSNMAEPCCMEGWEAEEDLRAYARAQAIMKDPERMKKMQALAKTKLEENTKRLKEAETLVELGGGEE